MLFKFVFALVAQVFVKKNDFCEHLNYRSVEIDKGRLRLMIKTYFKVTGAIFIYGSKYQPAIF